MLSFAAGNIAFVAAIQYQAVPASPSLADVGYLGFYPLASAGVLSLLGAAARSAGPRCSTACSAPSARRRRWPSS